MTEFQFSIDPHTPRNTFSLNGMWEIVGGDAEHIPQKFTSKVPVPAVVDMAQPAYDWQTFDFHWYRTSFSLDGLSDNQSIFLKISQSMFGTEVWLNGHHLGGSISCYTSHEYRMNGFLLRDTPNELIVRVGAKHTLPPESAVGRDQEKEIYTPGIWGDVSLTCTGGARVKLVQVIPYIDLATAEVRAWIENLEDEIASLIVSSKITEKVSHEAVSKTESVNVSINGNAMEKVLFNIPIRDMKLWSHETPFLYEAEISVARRSPTTSQRDKVLETTSVVGDLGGAREDECAVTFGMREFKIVGPDFYLNGKKILLRGGNIAFHRFLSDTQRRLLPWDEQWIKKALIDIPREHNFNFFRNHLGQMYNKWYDIADEHGMLIQNEWQFWCATGSDVQIRKEFTEWLHDNWNHPSIIMWDPLNESTDDTVQHEIVPEMKKLDPTRPWESVDVLEEHPYIYSLGMVLNNRKFGFARSLDEIEHLPVPSMVNEFLWWWFNDKWEPTVLTNMIVKRWMGREYTKEDLIAHQSFLAQELIELFRRMRVKAIQPFVYISNNDGPTAHWFLGDIKDLKPKPVLHAIKNAFAPFGTSIELWDRHFFVNEKRSVRFYVFNDSNEARRGTLFVGIKTSGGKWISKKEIGVHIPPVIDNIVTEDIMFPGNAGQYHVVAELHEHSSVVATSSKVAHLFEKPVSVGSKKNVLVLDPSHEIDAFLSDVKIPNSDFTVGKFEDASIVVTHGNVLGNRQYEQRRDHLTKWVRDGGTLVLIEPEFRVVGNVTYSVVDGVELKIFHRADLDKGGYDSYVFAGDQSHPMWKHVRKEHLKFFNGGYGGEIVSQYDVDFSVPSKRLASCGIDLNVTAASETEYGKGKIMLFRLQVRGRLMRMSEPDSLYVRRVDPVAQQLLLSIIEY